MFADLDEMLDGRCPLKLNEKTYYVPEPSALEGIRLQRLFADPTTELSDELEMKEIFALLGPVWDEMAADGIGQKKAFFAGRIALLYYAMGPEQALLYATGGLDDPGNPLPRMQTSRVRGRTDPGTQAEAPGTKRLGRANGSTTSRTRRTRGIRTTR